jgi:DNA-binding IscR family transcriptional regulator
MAAGLCTQEGCCAIRGHWQAIDQVLRNALDHTTLADLSRPVAAPMAQIAVPAPARQANRITGDKA